MLHVALEVPLAALDFGRLLQRDHARAARIQVLHEALDRAALAGRVATLEQDHDLLPGLLHPRLQLEQLDLQPVLLPLVALARHQVPVRIAPLAPVVGQFLVGPPGEILDAAALLVQKAPHQRHRLRGRTAGKDVLQCRDLRLLRGIDVLVDGETLDDRRTAEGSDVAGGHGSNTARAALRRGDGGPAGRGGGFSLDGHGQVLDAFRRDRACRPNDRVPATRPVLR